MKHFSKLPCAILEMKIGTGSYGAINRKQANFDIYLDLIDRLLFFKKKL